MPALPQTLLGAAFRASNAKPRQLPWQSSQACLLTSWDCFLLSSSPPFPMVSRPQFQLPERPPSDVFSEGQRSTVAY